MLFGAGNKIFMPHEAGYDLRFRLQDLYESGEIKLPAFPVWWVITSLRRDLT